MQHLGDDAELYALGLTGTDRVGEIEAHLAQCAECRARVVAAESVAASLSAALPAAPAAAAAATTTPSASTTPASSGTLARPVARRPWIAPLATAAALVFAATTAIEGSAARTATTQLATTDTALLAIAASHFGHTTLTTNSGVVAKAIYARDGAWCYLVVDHAPPGSHVVANRSGVARDLGALSNRAPATLFVRGAGKVERVEIVAGNQIVAHGVPVY